MLNGNEMKAFYRIFFPKRPDEGGLAARVPDVNETRLNDNFKTIGDEFRKIWGFIKNGFKTKSLTVDGDASVGGQLSAGSAALGDTNVNGALDVDGSATFDSGATIGGDLNVNGIVAGQGFADLLFGIGNSIPSNTNCNSLTSEGKYTCYSSAIAGTLTNSPYTDAFGMLVIRVAESQRLVQVAMPNSTTITIKLRYYNGTSWTAWKTLTPS